MPAKIHFWALLLLLRAGKEGADEDDNEGFGFFFFDLGGSDSIPRGFTEQSKELVLLEHSCPRTLLAKSDGTWTEAHLKVPSLQHN